MWWGIFLWQKVELFLHQMNHSLTFYRRRNACIEREGDRRTGRGGGRIEYVVFILYINTRYVNRQVQIKVRFNVNISG